MIRSVPARFRARFLATCALAFPTIAPTWAHAQAADGTEADNEITIYAPIRDAQEAALKEQRDADNLVNIIASDTVGRFPDQNSAAALARLPAVAVQRDQGQERYIQVRGAPNRWTSVSFDGVPVIGVDEGGSSRAFRFDAVPAVILNSIAVNKSLTPDLPADAIVAQIDLRTASPFDHRGFNIQGDLGYGWMGLGGGEQRQASLRASWSNDSFGVIAGLSHYRRDQVTDNREFSYDGDGILESFDARNYLLRRENNGAFVGLEWQPSAGNRIFAKAVFSEFKDDEQRNQYTFLLGDAISGTRGATGGDLVGVPVRSSTEFGKYRTRNYINTLGGDHEFGEGWQASWRVNYTRTENTTMLPIVLQTMTSETQRPSMTYDLSDPDLPIISLYSTVPGATEGSFVRGDALATLDQSAFGFNLALPYAGDTTSDSWTFKGDVTRELDGWTFKAGAQYDDRKIKGAVIGGSTIYLSPLLAAIGADDLPAGDYLTDKDWDTGMPLGITLKYIDNRRLNRDLGAALDALQAAGLYDPADNIPATNYYDIGEKLLSGYAMAKRDIGFGQIIFGLRVEHMKQSINGFIDVDGTVEPLGVSHSYTDFFPSINAKFDLSDDLVLRGSFQRGISRPSFGAIRTGASINDTVTPGTISGGNPNLKPEYTWGADVSLEYYLPGGGVLSLGAFHRWVDNVLYESMTIVGDDTYDTDGVDRSGYQFTSQFNGDKGRLYGVELSYLQQWSFLPSPLDGFGFQGNVALLDGSFDTPDRQNAPFPGTSKTIVNASLFYEKYGISARVSYQWRDDWADTLGGLGLGAGGDQYRKAYGNLDVSLRYAINENLTLFADLTNLTNETYVGYQGDRNHPTEVEQVGRRYLGGIRFSF